MKQWTTPRFLRALLGRTIIMVLLWAALSGGSFRDWPLIALSVAAAVAASMFMWPAQTWRWRPLGLLTFAHFFLWQSLIGGADVARRALSPRMRLAPGIIELDLRLQREPARVFFIWTVSLLPGSAGVGMDGPRVRIHTIDTHMTTKTRLRRLEDAVASLFGERLDGDLLSKRNAE